MTKKKAVNRRWTNLQPLGEKDIRRQWSSPATVATGSCGECAVRRAVEDNNLELGLRLSRYRAANEKDEAADFQRAIQASIEDQALLAALELSSNEIDGHDVDAAASSTVKQEVESLTLKVSLGSETRELELLWPCGKPRLVDAASSLKLLTAMHEVARSSFVAAELVLKYSDDEGDLCTLVEATMEDFLSLELKARCLEGPPSCSSRNNCSSDLTLRLWAEVPSGVTMPGGDVCEFSICTPPMSPRGSESFCHVEFVDVGALPVFSIATPLTSPRGSTVSESEDWILHVDSACAEAIELQSEEENLTAEEKGESEFEWQVVQQSQATNSPRGSMASWEQVGMIEAIPPGMMRGTFPYGRDEVEVVEQEASAEALLSYHINSSFRGLETFSESSG